MKTVWCIPIHEIWRCPRCGEVQSYGSKRSLWSLLPGICRHVVVEHDEDMSGLACVSVKRSISSRERGLKARLRARLSDELKGNRHFWWWKIKPEIKRERLQFRRSMQGH